RSLAADVHAVARARALGAPPASQHVGTVTAGWDRAPGPAGSAVRAALCHPRETSSLLARAASAPPRGTGIALRPCRGRGAGERIARATPATPSAIGCANAHRQGGGDETREEIHQEIGRRDEPGTAGRRMHGGARRLTRKSLARFDAGPCNEPGDRRDRGERRGTSRGRGSSARDAPETPPLLPPQSRTGRSPPPVLRPA